VFEGLLCFCLVLTVSSIPVEPENSNWSVPDPPPDINAHIPNPDGLLHFYVLPVGQGDAQIIQCPNGDLTVMDMGTSSGAAERFWVANDIVNYLNGHWNRIKNVIISHDHTDHYSFFPAVMSTARDLSGLTNVYVSCTYNNAHNNVKNWLTSIGAVNKVRTFNGGQPCGPLRPNCGNIDICPGNNAITARVLSANLENCINSNKNIDSIVFKLVYGSVSIMWNGDFEDATASQTANGHQRAMVDFYGNDLKVTVYKLSHHAAENLANKEITCAAHAPKAIFVSGNTWYTSYRHPRCTVIDRFRDQVKSLCRPLETNSGNAFFCSVHPENPAADNKLQRVYTCGDVTTDVNGGIRTISNNDLAIYTTVPDISRMNLIKFSADGTRWGFTNNFSTLKTRTSIEVEEADAMNLQSDEPDDDLGA